MSKRNNMWGLLHTPPTGIFDVRPKRERKVMGCFYLKETPCGVPWHVVCYFHAAKHLKVLKTLNILKVEMLEKNSSDFSQSNQIVQKYRYMYSTLCNFRDMDSYLC